MRERNMKINNNKKVFHSMKVIYENTIGVNSDLKLNVDEEQDDTKHLKEQCDIDYEDEVQEIRAAITPMKKKKPVCV